MLRQASLSDFETVYAMCAKFSEQIALRDYVDPERLAELVTSFLQDDDKTVFLHGQEGMLAACVTPFLLGPTLTAVELAWWVEPEYRKQNVGLNLVKAYEEWALAKGCKIISMACYANNNLGPFYEKCGYGLNELGYVKCLPL